MVGRGRLLVVNHGEPSETPEAQHGCTIAFALEQ